MGYPSRANSENTCTWRLHASVAPSKSPCTNACMPLPTCSGGTWTSIPKCWSRRTKASPMLGSCRLAKTSTKYATFCFADLIGRVHPFRFAIARKVIPANRGGLRFRESPNVFSRIHRNGLLRINGLISGANRLASADRCSICPMSQVDLSNPWRRTCSLRMASIQLGTSSEAGHSDSHMRH